MNLNGVEYVEASSVNVPKKLGTKIVIASQGWIFVGEAIDSDNDSIALVNASVVRKWTNGRGIGGLCKAEYKSEYTLDACYGAMEIPFTAINAILDCEW